MVRFCHITPVVELSPFYPFKIYSSWAPPPKSRLQVTNKNTLKKFPLEEQQALLFILDFLNSFTNFATARVSPHYYFAWNLAALHYYPQSALKREISQTFSMEHDITTPIWAAAAAECVWGFSPLRKREITPHMQEHVSPSKNILLLLSLYTDAQ